MQLRRTERLKTGPLPTWLQRETDAVQGQERHLAAAPFLPGSQINLFGNRQRVIHLNTEAAYRVLYICIISATSIVPPSKKIGFFLAMSSAASMFDASTTE